VYVRQSHPQQVVEHVESTGVSHLLPMGCFTGLCGS
jgi:hypothetical protein